MNTIFDYIEHNAKENPNKLILYTKDVCISNKQLYEMIIYAQNFYRAKYGGNTVLLKYDTDFNFTLSILILLSLEAWVIPLQNNLTEFELTTLLSNIDYIEFDYEILKNLDDKSNINSEFIKPDGENCGIYHCTSGTTSEYKLCIRTLNSISFEGLSYKDTLCVNSDDNITSLCPLYHSYAFGAAIMLSMVSAATLFLDKMTPRKILNHVNENKITILLLVPKLAELLTKINTQITLTKMKYVLVGSGVVTDQLNSKFYNKFQINLTGNYGSTETGGLITLLDHTKFPCMGKPMQGVICKIIQSEDYPEGIGELYIKTGSMLKGYVNSSEVCFDSEGFFGMGDLAMNSNGYFYFIDRIKRVIDIGGKKILPSEIEKVIKMLPSIKDCVVVLLREKDRVLLAAYIEGRESTSEELYKHCSNLLSKNKIPSRFIFADNLPRNSMGKINYKKIRKEHLEDNFEI